MCVWLSRVRTKPVVPSTDHHSDPSNANSAALRYEVDNQQSTIKLKKRLGDGSISPKDHLNTIYERSNEQGYIILHGKGKPSRLVEMDFSTGELGRENHSFGKEAHSIQVSRKKEKKRVRSVLYVI